MGRARFDDNGGGSVNLEPNSSGGPTEDGRYVEPPSKISGDADRYDHRQGGDDDMQAGNLYRLPPADEEDRLHGAIAGAMAGVPQEIVERRPAHFKRADPACGNGAPRIEEVGEEGQAPMRPPHVRLNTPIRRLPYPRDPRAGPPCTITTSRPLIACFVDPGGQPIAMPFPLPRGTGRPTLGRWYHPQVMEGASYPC